MNFLLNAILISLLMFVGGVIITGGWYMLTDETPFETYRNWRERRAERHPGRDKKVCHVCGELREVRYVPPECLDVVVPTTARSYVSDFGYAVQICEDCRLSHWYAPKPKETPNA